MPNPRPGLVFCYNRASWKKRVQPHTPRCSTPLRQQLPQRLCPRHLPQCCLLSYLLQDESDVRVAAIEDTTIAEFPDRLRCEDDQGVQPFPSSFRRPARSPSPPIFENVKVQRWGQVQQADLSKNGCPYLSGEDTRSEDVLNCLLLIAEKATVWVL